MTIRKLPNQHKWRVLAHTGRSFGTYPSRAQVIKGTYEYGEDKILQTTLPKAMIDHAFKLYEEEIKQAKESNK